MYIFLWLPVYFLGIPLTLTHIIFYEASHPDRFQHSSLIIMWMVIIPIIEKSAPRARRLLINLSGLSFVLILILSFLYAWHWCVIVNCIGGLLNTIVMSANQGKMPVIGSSGLKMNMDFRHNFINHKTRLLVLCDWIVVPNRAVISIGDVLLYSSGYMSLGHIVLPKYF